MLTDYRCIRCNALLFKGHLEHARIEIKCKCGVLNLFAEQPKTESITLDFFGGNLSSASEHLTSERPERQSLREYSEREYSERG